MSKHNKPIRQHHVPKVYLKKFCAEDGAIAVLDKTRKRIFSTGLDAVAVEKDFYTVDGLKDPYYWEKFYAENVEPLMSEVLSTIISRVNVLVQTGHCIINGNEKFQLALIMMMQLLRGKQNRIYQEKIFDELLSPTIEKAKEKFAPLSDEQQKQLDAFYTDPQYFKQISMEVTWDIERLIQYTNVLSWHGFIFYHICGDMEFATSDNPVMFINSRTADVQPFTNGLVRETTLIYYPISPKLLLCAVHPNAFFNFFSDKDGCLYHLNTNEEENFITSINRKQCSQCYNQVFSLTEETLRKIKK